jgi:hypothetical protein
VARTRAVRLDGLADQEERLAGRSKGEATDFRCGTPGSPSTKGEHFGHAPMQELHEFRKDQGLVVNDDGTVSVEDL